MTEKQRYTRFMADRISRWSIGDIWPAYDDYETPEIDRLVERIVRGQVSYDATAFASSAKPDRNLERLGHKLEEMEKGRWGQEIYFIRTKILALTQQELADRLGVVMGSVGKWETGHTRPSKKHLADIRRMAAVKIKKGNRDAETV